MKTSYTVLLVLIHGCSKGESAISTRYQMSMRVSERASATPEMQASLGPVRDTLTLILKVDSTRADSTFGSYQGNLRGLGVVVGRSPARPNQFVLVQKGDSLDIRLEPGSIDGSLRMHGVSTPRGAHGIWRGEAPPTTSGTFVMQPA